MRADLCLWKGKVSWWVRSAVHSFLLHSSIVENSTLIFFPSNWLLAFIKKYLDPNLAPENSIWVIKIRFYKDFFLFSFSPLDVPKTSEGDVIFHIVTSLHLFFRILKARPKIYCTYVSNVSFHILLSSLNMFNTVSSLNMFNTTLWKSYNIYNFNVVRIYFIALFQSFINVKN